jgi:hypothetical protein
VPRGPRGVPLELEIAADREHQQFPLDPGSPMRPLSALHQLVRNKLAAPPGLDEDTGTEIGRGGGEFAAILQRRFRELRGLLPEAEEAA